MPTHLAIIFDKSENSFRRELYPSVQGQPFGAARGPGAAVPADARQRARLRPDAGGAGPLRGRRPHRHLRRAGPRARRRRADHLRRQGPDAARARRRRDVRPGLRRTRRRRLARRAQDRPRGGVRLFRRRSRTGGRRPGAGRRFHRQRAGRQGHRRQDRGAAHHRVRRPRHAAGHGPRDQAAEEARNADRPRQRQADPAVARTRQAEARRGRLAVPLDALGLAEPDGRTLVAYFKALEFTTLAKRAAEGYGVEAAEIEPDPAFAGTCRLAQPPRREDRRRRRALRRPGAERPLRPAGAARRTRHRPRCAGRGA